MDEPIVLMRFSCEEFTLGDRDMDYDWPHLFLKFYPPSLHNPLDETLPGRQEEEENSFDSMDICRDLHKKEISVFSQKCDMSDNKVVRQQYKALNSLNFDMEISWS